MMRSSYYTPQCVHRLRIVLNRPLTEDFVETQTKTQKLTIASATPDIGALACCLWWGEGRFLLLSRSSLAFPLVGVLLVGHRKNGVALFSGVYVDACYLVLRLVLSRVVASV